MNDTSTKAQLTGSVHNIPQTHRLLSDTSPQEAMTVTLILRRKQSGSKLREVKDFAAKATSVSGPVNREQFAATHGADPQDMAKVTAFARANGLEVKDTNAAARSIVVQGKAADFNRLFKVKLQDYQGRLGKYHSHTGPVTLPGELATVVEAVIGLHNRPIHARAHNTAHHRSAKDPTNTKPLTPQQMAQLYTFPSGDGAGQTIGIYEMAVEDQSGQLANAGYTAQDVASTMNGFGVKVPKIINVPIDGVDNSGVNDGETLLDITVAGAIAPAATIAVYFAGAETQNMIHALQRMIHPQNGDPVPNIISISYGWGPDDDQAGFSEDEFNQFGQLFQDAANLFITVLISSGDQGCFIDDGINHAQASYPATEPMVIACGGTTVGNVRGLTFDEYVWNDVGAAGPGASGGGVSGRFGVPDYQTNAGVPKHAFTKKAGRGIPDLAGNASENSGYMQHAAGFQTQPVGGTSAVAPLYAGLFARINSNLGVSVGFVNPIIYGLGGTAFRDILGPPGPSNNSFNGVTGYPVDKGWDACTGWGSVNGVALQDGLKAANAGSRLPTN